MNIISLFMMTFVVSSALPERANQHDTFCEEYTSQVYDAKLTLDEKAVIDICNAELPGFEGPILIVGGRYIPFPKEFYVIADQSHYLLALTSVDATIGIQDWPYVTAGVSLSSPLDSIDAARVSVESLPAPVLVESCDISIDLRRVEIQVFEGGYTQSATEALFEGYSLAIFGESPDLLRAIMDSFVRLNCETRNKK